MPTAATISTPSVAMMRASGDARRSGRMTSRCVERAEQRPTPRRRRPARPERLPVLDLHLPCHVRADHADRAEGEVEDAGAPVDDHQALGRQRVERADAEAEQGEAEDLLHVLPEFQSGPSMRRAGATEAAPARPITSHRSAGTPSNGFVMSSGSPSIGSTSPSTTSTDRAVEDARELPRPRRPTAW